MAEKGLFLALGFSEAEAARFCEIARVVGDYDKRLRDQEWKDREGGRNLAAARQTAEQTISRELLAGLTAIREGRSYDLRVLMEAWAMLDLAKLGQSRPIERDAYRPKAGESAAFDAAVEHRARERQEAIAARRREAEWRSWESSLSLEERKLREASRDKA